MRRLLLLALCAACARTAPLPVIATAGGDAAPGDTVELIVASTTDVHGWLRGWDYFGNSPDTTRGMSRIATIVDSLRTANPDRVLFVDAGDDLQGTPITSIALRDSLQSNPIIAAMNAARYDAGVIGNHEFNYGMSYLTRAVSQAKFPMLAANVYKLDGSPAFTPSVMLSRAGLRVAIIGATTPGTNVWDGPKLRVSVGDIVPSVRASVADARRRGADVVIVLLHSGLNEPSSYDTVATKVASENVSARVAREVPGIDLIVFGHTHKELADTTIGTALLTQPRNWAGSVSIARLAVARAGSGWRVVARSARVMRPLGVKENAAVLAATEDAHARAVQFARTPIGSTTVAWRADSARVRDTPIIDFVNEVQRRTAGTDLSSAPAFSLNAQFGPGAITMADIAQLYPYENNVLVAMKISGKQLREYLEHSARYFRAAGRGDSLVDQGVPGFNYDIVSGVDYVIDISRPIGSRITTLTRGGRPVVDTDSFTLALNDYRASGGGGYSMLRGSPVVYEQQQVTRQLLVAEVQRRGVLRPEDFFTQNWKLEPDSLVGPAYRSMRRLPFDRPRATATNRPPLKGPRLRVISTNDIHGYIESWVDRDGIRRGSAAALSNMIARAKSECPPPECVSLVVDGGDMMQGPALSALAYGKPVIDILNRIGYDAAAVGNHEFDWGPDTLRARMRQAHFPILSANTFREGKDVPWIPNDTILTRGSYRIGIIGLTTTSAGYRSRAGADGFQFPDPAPIVDSLSRSLRERGAHVVIVLSHAGARCGNDGATDCRGEIMDFAKAVGHRVDAIISGDSHTFVDTDVDGIPVVQARSWAQAITVTDVPLARGIVPEVARHEVRSVLPDSVRADTAIAAIVQRAADAVAPKTSVAIATIRDSLLRRGDEYALGRVIADAQRAAGKGDIAVMNNGGIRQDLRPGVATYGMLFEVQPFLNRLWRITTSGAAIREYFENIVAKDRPGIHISGVTVRYDRTRPKGQRIVALRLANGQAIADATRYTLIVNEFMAQGGDNSEMVTKPLKSEVLSVTDLDALVAWLRASPTPFVAPREPRFVNVAPQ